MLCVCSFRLPLCGPVRALVFVCGGTNEAVEVAFCCVVCVDGVVVVRVYEYGGVEALRVAEETRVLDGAEFVCVEEVEASPVPHALVCLVPEGVSCHGF